MGPAQRRTPAAAPQRHRRRRSPALLLAPPPPTLLQRRRSSSRAGSRAPTTGSCAAAASHAPASGRWGREKRGMGTSCRSCSSRRRSPPAAGAPICHRIPPRLLLTPPDPTRRRSCSYRVPRFSPRAASRRCSSRARAAGRRCSAPAPVPPAAAAPRPLRRPLQLRPAPHLAPLPEVEGREASRRRRERGGER
ncbi:unnamed protein product [Urochloa humidicola]